MSNHIRTGYTYKISFYGSIFIILIALCMPFIPPSTISSIRAASRSIRPLTRVSAISLPFALFSSSTPRNDMSFPVQKSDKEWRAVLSKEQFRVLREQGTERPGSSKYDHSFDDGVYHCAACDAPLYTSKTKFDSGCGWPAFFDTVPGAVIQKEDKSLFMTRTEIVCANCGSHLGHVFKNEGFSNPTNERHCVNGISLNFKDDDAKAK